MICDHRDDEHVRKFSARVEREQGRIDLLVNNAALLHENLIDPGLFWNKPLELVDILDIGLRSAYVASYYAAPLLVRNKYGLIVFVFYFGAGCYMHGPAYGAQKAGCDKLAADVVVDFECTEIFAVSLWLDPHRTERTAIAGAERTDQYDAFMAMAETSGFNGRVIRSLLDAADLASLSGQTLISVELALGYGISDESGRHRPSYREILGALR